jgi:hypothetical protein
MGGTIHHKNIKRQKAQNMKEEVPFCVFCTFVTFVVNVHIQSQLAFLALNICS